MILYKGVSIRSWKPWLGHSSLSFGSGGWGRFLKRKRSYQDAIIMPLTHYRQARWGTVSSNENKVGWLSHSGTPGNNGRRFLSTLPGFQTYSKRFVPDTKQEMSFFFFKEKINSSLILTMLKVKIWVHICVINIATLSPQLDSFRSVHLFLHIRVSSWSQYRRINPIEVDAAAMKFSQFPSKTNFQDQERRGYLRELAHSGKYSPLDHEGLTVQSLGLAQKRQHMYTHARALCTHAYACTHTHMHARTQCTMHTHTHAHTRIHADACSLVFTSTALTY